ncbi:pitslre [Carabus blaptoides fortunei]
MSYAGSGGDDQSEDGELRHSPSDLKKGDDVLDFSLSDEDADTADSLDIKPPQASRLPHSNSGSSRNKRRDRNREGRSRHGRSERHRDAERGHGHREKHHRDRSNRERDQKYEREASYREKEHFRERDMYREKELYMAKQEYSKESFREQRYSESTLASYKESKYMELQQYSRRDELKYTHEGTSRADVRYVESSSSRKYDESKRQKDMERYTEKEILRYAQEPDNKSRRYEEKQDRRLKSAADQTLDDLRERLLDKKRMKESSDEYKHYEKESRRKNKDREMDSTSIEDAEMFVKEIIDLSTADESAGAGGQKERKDKHKREPKEEPMDWSARVEEEVEVAVEKKQLTDAEREEQELRKEKLLEAEREIARQKEQYKLDRERRHQRRLERQEAKRRLLAEQEQEHQQRKRQRMSGELGQYKDKDLSIVTVSDNSSAESSDNEVAEHRASDSEDGDHTADEDEPEVEESAPGDTSSGDERAAASDSEQSDRRRVERTDDEDEDMERNQARYNDQDSPMSVGGLAKSDRDTSQSRSRSPSPKSNGQVKAKDKEPTEPKPKSPEPLLKKLDEGLSPYFPAIQGCRSVEEFQCLNRIEEGTYGVVYRARDKRTEEIVALKRLKMEKEKEGFPITSLREINTLLKGQHPNIVTVREIVVGSNMDKIFIVMDYVEHDLKSLMETMRNRRQVFVPGEVKCLLKQLLGAVAHLHDNWILHRDLKTSNLLLSHKGILKVGDFGLAREYGSPLKAYTPIVVTLWYRAPELLLCCKEYSTPIDMWSVGCIFAELLLMNALFPGKSEVDQLNRIFKDLGTPNEKIWPGYNELPAVKKMKFTEFPVSQIRNRFGMLSELGQNLLQRFLTYDPTQRITAEDALQHAYFSEAPLPIDPAMFPTWPAKSELGHRKAMAASPKPPSGGREYKQLGDGDEDSALGFHMGGSSSSTSLLEARRLAMGGGFSLKF